LWTGSAGGGQGSRAVRARVRGCGASQGACAAQCGSLEPELLEHGPQLLARPPQLLDHQLAAARRPRARRRAATASRLGRRCAAGGLVRRSARPSQLVRPGSGTTPTLESNLEDILSDFPDSDQYNNPRHRLVVSSQSSKGRPGAGWRGGCAGQQGMGHWWAGRPVRAGVGSRPGASAHLYSVSRGHLRFTAVTITSPLFLSSLHVSSPAFA
jgi:hypothetical protein